MAGISLSEYRARIGQFRGGRRSVTMSEPHTDSKLLHLDNVYKLSIATRIILFLLLVIHGIERNPGPNSPDLNRRNEANQPSSSYGAPREPEDHGRYSSYRGMHERYSGNQPNSSFIPGSSSQPSSRSFGSEPSTDVGTNQGTNRQEVQNLPEWGPVSEIQTGLGHQFGQSVPRQHNQGILRHGHPQLQYQAYSQSQNIPTSNDAFRFQQPSETFLQRNPQNITFNLENIDQSRCNPPIDSTPSHANQGFRLPYHQPQVLPNQPSQMHFGQFQCRRIMGPVRMLPQNYNYMGNTPFPPVHPVNSQAPSQNLVPHSSIPTIQQNVQPQTPASSYYESPTDIRVQRMKVTSGNNDQSGCNPPIDPNSSNTVQGTTVQSQGLRLPYHHPVHQPHVPSNQPSQMHFPKFQSPRQLLLHNFSLPRDMGHTHVSLPNYSYMGNTRSYPAPVFPVNPQVPSQNLVPHSSIPPIQQNVQPQTPVSFYHACPTDPKVPRMMVTRIDSSNQGPSFSGAQNHSMTQPSDIPSLQQNVQLETQTSINSASPSAPGSPRMTTPTEQSGQREGPSSSNLQIEEQTSIEHSFNNELSQAVQTHTQTEQVSAQTILQNDTRYREQSSSRQQTPQQLDMTTPEAQQTVADFIKACNDTARKNTKDKVTSTFDHLQTPEKQVNPGFKVTNFYRGETSLESDQYIPDSLYVNYTQRSFKGKNIRLSQFLDDVNYGALVADAGAGKTTAAKRFTQLALNNKISNLSHIKLVHYIRFAEMEWEKEHLSFDLLFKQVLGSSISDDMKRYGYQWVKEHPSEIMFILDGLDQASWSLDNETHNIDYDQPATAPIIFQNILNERLLPGCKVLVTSREHAIQNCPANIRPKKTIALTGLSNKDRDYLILQLGGIRGQAILDYLKQKSPGLLSLCSTPIFNVFTVVVLLEDLKSAPETMSGILIRILVYFLNSEYRRVCNIKTVFTKLKQLAYDGTSEKRVLFQRNEITCLGLDVDQINDLIVVTPYLSIPSHFKLMDGQLKLFFCHQSFQEALSALYICEMSSTEFKKFVQEHLDDPHFSVVRRILFGVLLNSSLDIPVNKPILDTISDKHNKQLVLKEWLENVLDHQENNRRRRIDMDDDEIYTLLHECGDGAHEVIQSDLHSIHLNERVLAAERLYTVASVMSHCKENINVFVPKLHPNKSDFDLVLSMVRGNYTKFQIDKLKLPSGTNYIEFLNGLLSHQKQSAEEKTLEIKSLIVQVGDETDDESLILLLNFAAVAKSEILLKASRGSLSMSVRDVNGCKEIKAYHNERWTTIDENILKQFKRIATLPHTKIKELKFWLGDTMESKALHHVGEIVMIGNVENLDLSNCSIKEEKLSELKQSLAGFSGQIKEIILRNNCNMDPKALHHVGEIVMIGNVESLNLRNCTLNEEKLRELKQSLARFNGQIKHLDVSMNEDQHFGLLGEIVQMCQVEELIVCSFRKTRPNQVDEFITSVGEWQNNVRIKYKEDGNFGSVEEWKTYAIKD